MARCAPKKNQMGKVARRAGTQGWKKAGEGLTCGLWRDERLSLDDVLGRNLLGTPRAKALKQRSAWYIPGMTKRLQWLFLIFWGATFENYLFLLKWKPPYYFISPHNPSINRKKKEIRAAAAAAMSLQSRLTLCDPIDGRPPGTPTPVPGILQARRLEWVAISFFKA